MYRDILERIIGRAAIDSDFRRMIIENPDEAFKEYDLTEEQISALKNIPIDALEKFARQLTESIKKGRTEA